MEAQTRLERHWMSGAVDHEELRNITKEPEFVNGD